MDDKQTLLVPKDSAIHFSDFSTQERLAAVKEIASAAVPNILSNVGTFLKDVISLYFVGHLNNPLLFAAFGFGMTWVGAFGTAIIFGFSAGFGTFASQAYGAGNYRKLGILYQRSIVVNALVMLCLSVILFFTEAILLAFDFEAELAANIGEFVRYMIFDLFLCIIFGMTQFYLIAQNIYNVPAYILLFCTGFHVIWCYLFINVFELGLVGMALARTITDTTSVILIFLYIRVKNPNPESWFPWTSECLENLVAFTKDLASYGSSVYMEWVVFELSAMLIGYLGDVTVLAGHTATANYMAINWTFCLGVTVSTSVLVGNAAGEGNVRKAKKYCYMGLLMNLAIMSCLDLILFVSRDNIALFYTEEQNVRNVIKILLTFYCFGMHCDLGANSVAYLLRTLGQDRFVLKGFIISYYGVGLTCSLLSALVFGFGYYGIWTSLISGFYVMVVLTVYRFINLDWEKEIEKISKEMKKPMPVELEEIKSINS